MEEVTGESDDEDDDLFAFPTLPLILVIVCLGFSVFFVDCCLTYKGLSSIGDTLWQKMIVGIFQFAASLTDFSVIQAVIFMFSFPFDFEFCLFYLICLDLFRIDLQNPSPPSKFSPAHFGPSIRNKQIFGRFGFQSSFLRVFRVPLHLQCRLLLSLRLFFIPLHELCYLSGSGLWLLMPFTARSRFILSLLRILSRQQLLRLRLRHRPYHRTRHRQLRQRHRHRHRDRHRDRHRHSVTDNWFTNKLARSHFLDGSGGCAAAIQTLYISMVFVNLILVLFDNPFYSIRRIHFTKSDLYLGFKQTRVVDIRMGRLFPRIIGARCFLFRSSPESLKFFHSRLLRWDIDSLGGFTVDCFSELTSHPWVTMRFQHLTLADLTFVCRWMLWFCFFSWVLCVFIKKRNEKLTLAKLMDIFQRSPFRVLCSGIVSALELQFIWVGRLAHKPNEARLDLKILAIGQAVWNEPFLGSTIWVLSSRYISNCSRFTLQAFSFVFFLCIMWCVLLKLMKYVGISRSSDNLLKTRQDDEEVGFHHYGVIPFCLKGYIKTGHLCRWPGATTLRCMATLNWFGCMVIRLSASGTQAYFLYLTFLLTPMGTRSITLFQIRSRFFVDFPKPILQSIVGDNIFSYGSGLDGFVIL